MVGWPVAVQLSAKSYYRRYVLKGDFNLLLSCCLDYYSDSDLGEKLLHYHYPNENDDLGFKQSRMLRVATMEASPSYATALSYSSFAIVLKQSQCCFVVADSLYYITVLNLIGCCCLFCLLYCWRYRCQSLAKGGFLVILSPYVLTIVLNIRFNLC